MNKVYKWNRLQTWEQFHLTYKILFLISAWIFLFLMHMYVVIWIRKQLFIYVYYLTLFFTLIYIYVNDENVLNSLDDFIIQYNTDGNVLPTLPLSVLLVCLINLVYLKTW